MATKSKLKFREFVEIQASLMPAVNFAPGSSAFYDLLRLWNGVAILFPEKCEDVVTWPKGGVPTTFANDLEPGSVLSSLAKKPLDNLPDDLRTGYRDHKAQQQELQKKKETEKVLTNQDVPPPADIQGPQVDAAKKEDEPEPELAPDDEVVVPEHAKKEKPKSAKKNKKASRVEL